MSGLAAIRLQFATESAVSSALIRWRGIGLYSHVDAVLPDGRLLGARYAPDGAPRAGVAIRPPGYARFTRLEQVAVDAPTALVAAFYCRLWSQLGAPYSWRAILSVAACRDLADDGRWDCVALQAWALVAEGLLPAMLAPHVWRLTPDDLYLMMLSAAHSRSALARGLPR